ncbi:hypothetical protein [Pseudomonas sp.]|uniref:hypothetical protein n=1 Tax=Pseudomonas sp. TaxID=306 RepID=UPI003FD8C8ED
MAGPTKDKQTAAQKATRFDGEKSNRNVKGNSKVRINKSKLRELADKLLERQGIALELIDKSLNSKPVDPDAVASAKWVIASINSVIKSASAEELGSFNARLKGKREDEIEEQTPSEIAKELKPRLSLVYVDPSDEEDEE